MKLLIIMLSLFALNANALTQQQSDPKLHEEPGTSYCPAKMQIELAKNSQERNKATQSKARALQ